MLQKSIFLAKVCEKRANYVLMKSQLHVALSFRILHLKYLSVINLPGEMFYRRRCS